MCHELVYPSETSESYLTITSIITTTGIKITHSLYTMYVINLHICVIRIIPMVEAGN